MLIAVRAISDLVNIAYVRQKRPLGLGHALLATKPLVGREPFAVVLSDDIIDAPVPCLRQLLDVYDTCGDPVLALMEVRAETVSSYGMVDAEVVSTDARGRLFRIHDLVEKPRPEQSPSNLAIIGRYILTPDVFDCLEHVGPGAGGEIQLTDALRHLVCQRPIYGFRFEGIRYDAGDKLGFLQAMVHFALRRPHVGAQFRGYLQELRLNACAGDLCRYPQD